MGTSNLYKGPKGSSLLPADYTGEPDEQTVPTTEGEAPEEDQPENDNPQEEENPEQEESQQEEQPRVTWTQAKRTFSNQIGKHHPDVKWVAKTYTKASGGYKHAAKTSGVAPKRSSMTFILISAPEPRRVRMRWQTKPCHRPFLSCLRAS